MGIATDIARIASRTSLWREMPRDPEERRIWLASLDLSRPCELCGGELPEEAVSRHICCRCLDAGFFRKDGKSEPCSCRLTGIPEQEFVRRAGIPRDMRGYSLDGWGGKPGMLQWAQEYVSQWPPAKPLALMTGVVGGGKTGLSVAILRALWAQHHLVGRFTTAPDLMRRFYASFQEEALESTEAIHREMETAPLVVLDDYGTEKATDFAAQEMFRLINGRMENGRPLIVTTNMDLLELDQRVTSRLRHKDRSTWLQFTGPDRRLAS